MAEVKEAGAAAVWGDGVEMASGQYLGKHIGGELDVRLSW